MPSLSGADLRAWRHGHGLYAREVGPLWGVTAQGVRAWERDWAPVPLLVREYVAAHPAPPLDPTYPPTPEGLRAAMARWEQKLLWCRWWGIPTATLYRWLAGSVGLPITVQAWLRAGAPTRWGMRQPLPRLVLPLRARQAAPRRRIRRPGPDWVWLVRQGYAPPAGYCDPERDALRLSGCAACCYRGQCADLQGAAS